MNEKRVFILFVLCLLLIAVGFASSAEQEVNVQVPVDAIKSYGNVILPVTHDEIEAAGMHLGDLIDFSFGGQTIVMPYCTNYSNVDSGLPVLVWREDHDDHAAAIFNGDFATAYGFARKNEDGKWVSDEGETVIVTISLNEAGAYYDEYIVRSVSYTDDRADYPNLTDAEFANFREVKTTGIAPGMLYRGASPIDNTENRAACAAVALEEAGVRVVLNLSDSVEGMQEMELYPGSYYAGLDVIALDMNMDMCAPENMVKLAEGLRFALSHEGPVYVHCLEGKDRCGFVCAVLERLAGASREEIIADYMVSYANYYGLTEDSEAYPLIAAGFEKSLVKGMGGELDAADYLLRCGLTEQEIEALTLRLTGN